MIVLTKSRVPQSKPDSTVGFECKAGERSGFIITVILQMRGLPTWRKESDEFVGLGLGSVQQVEGIVSSTGLVSITKMASSEVVSLGISFKRDPTSVCDRDFAISMVVKKSEVEQFFKL